MVCALISSPARAVTITEVTAPETGVKAWLVEDHKLPIVAMRFAFQGGSEQDPADKQGLAHLTMNALTEGAGSYDSAAFQRQLADKSITLAFSDGRDELVGGIKCLSADKAEAFKLLHLALTKPRFDANDIERLRGQQLAAMRQQFSDPDWQARYALFSQIFAGHPYSQRHLGTMQTLKAITRADIQDFAAHHLALDNVTVAVAGDMTPAELATALDKIFADLPAKAQLTPIADVDEMTDTPSILVRREGTQTEMLFAMPGPKRDDPDYYAAQIANYILGGGGFSSRLMQDVRDKKGLTYGISTELAPAQHDGLIIGESDVDNPKVGEALDTIRDTMRRFHDEGPTVREIAAAKDYLTGSQPLSLTSTDKIAATLVYMQRHNLGRDYLDRYSEIIRNVTAQDITQVLDRWFSPDKMTIAYVGEPEGMTPTQIRDMVRQ
ncbi:MAG: pitrilysin family protein [Alphaproteobacteria bacterium]|nr:pitrilysin family protein [Alphaproteobacteria bacterium]